MGDGNGWVTDCSCGRRHWGVHGAAGLLLTDGAQVLLQLRGTWSHEGGTWSVPGGARDSGETPLQAALRETGEETDLDLATVEPVGIAYTDDHGQWSYTTELATTPVAVAALPTNFESDAVRWWPIDEVAGLPLHTGFASSWPHLLELLSALHAAGRDDPDAATGATEPPVPPLP